MGNVSHDEALHLVCGVGNLYRNGEDLGDLMGQVDADFQKEYKDVKTHQHGESVVASFHAGQNPYLEVQPMAWDEELWNKILDGETYDTDHIDLRELIGTQLTQAYWEYDLTSHTVKVIIPNGVCKLVKGPSFGTGVDASVPTIRIEGQADLSGTYDYAMRVSET